MAMGVFRDLFVYRHCKVYHDPDVNIEWTLYTDCELIRSVGLYKPGRYFLGIALQDGILNFDEEFLYHI